MVSFGLGLGLDFVSADVDRKKNIIEADGKRIGMLGLDTGHCVAFSKVYERNDIQWSIWKSCRRINRKRNKNQGCCNRAIKTDSR